MTKTQAGILYEVLRKVDSFETGASFYQDKDKDAECKRAIKLWLETWIREPIAVAISLDYKNGVSQADRDYYRRLYA